MTELYVGDLIEYRCNTWQIRGYDGLVLEMKCLDDGSSCALPVGKILSDETFVGPSKSGPSVADQRLLDLLAPQRRREAELWYEHMYEVKHGVALRDHGMLSVEAPAGTVASRLVAKRSELMKAGMRVSMSTMWRKWRGFNDHGVIGCADHRGMPGHVRLPQTDPRVEAAIQAVKIHFVDKSTPTQKQIIEMARYRLEEDGVPLPCRSSMYELIKKLDRGEHTTGDATSRRSHANSPDRAFGKIVALFPGEEVQMDSTPLDAMVIMADGTVGRVDLAAGIDVATGTVTAAVLRPNACKSVDAIELLAKSMVPQQMVPGWREHMDTARNYLPNVMAAESELDTSLANKPVIDVRGVVVDRGKINVSDTFVRAVETRGIEYRLAPPYSPTAKPHIERLFGTISHDFVRWIPGYKGRSASHRGRRSEKDAVWPLPLLQALLDEWIITVYQNRPHSGIRITSAPRLKLSPNAMYRALAEFAPSLPRTLTLDEWISLQPYQFRRINRYGINLFKLIYDSDSPRFHDMRRTKSSNRKQNGRWEVRYDPNNLLRIWVRDEAPTYDDHGRPVFRDNGWIECHWVLAKFASVPFGVDVLHAIRRDLGKNVTDKRVLERAEAIHRQLLGGPSAVSRWSLSRAESAAGRANLSRQELCTAAPDSAEPADSDGPARSKGAEPLRPLPEVEPMRPMRLSTSW